MFRFTIRELVLLTIITAMGMAWWIDRQGLLGATEKARSWRGRAGALESILRENGWKVDWHFDSGEVSARKNGIVTWRTTSQSQPSATDSPDEN